MIEQSVLAYVLAYAYRDNRAGVNRGGTFGKKRQSCDVVLSATSNDFEISMRKNARSAVDQLIEARRLVSSTPDVLGGTPVFKGTRIPMHDIADMLANGDSPEAIVKAYPQLNKDRVRLAAVYALACPRPSRAPMRSSRLPPRSNR